MLGNSPFTWVVSDVNTGYRGSCIKVSQGMVITGIAKQSTFSFAVLDILDVLKERYDIVAPITDRLVSYCLENALLVSLEDPKTIEDLRKELDFPNHRIYNKLRQLEEGGQITVDRSGRLNAYQRVESSDH